MWWGGGGSDPDPVEEVRVSFVSYKQSQQYLFC